MDRVIDEATKTHSRAALLLLRKTWEWHISLLCNKPNEIFATSVCFAYLCAINESCGLVRGLSECVNHEYTK